MRVSTAARNAWLETLNATIGSGGKLKGYTGSIPATPETSATGTLLFTLNLAGTPLTAPASGGAISFAAISSAAAGNGGTIGYIRVETSGGTGVLDFPASELTTPGLLSSGTTVSASSLTASVPLGS
jgi:hypothetical protein